MCAKFLAGFAGVTFLGFLANNAPGGEPPTPTTSLRPVPISQVAIDDEFWTPKMKVWRDVTIPDCFAKFERDGALANFDKIRDGIGGDHGGPPWYDGLIYEMIRASADFLAENPDPKLEARLDGYIERIAAAAARDPDGYINTYTLLKEPGHRWGMNGGDDKWQHDLYNAGALVDAGVHYYRATGKVQILQVAVKLANTMTDTMGPSPKANVIPGHALAEEAFAGLWQLFKEQPQLKTKMTVPVDEQRYLALAQFWIDDRGHHTGRRDFGAYDQDEVPVAQQKTVEGHAVRATLLYSAMAAIARLDGRVDYLTDDERLWRNMTQCRMYITGGLGAVAGYEGFGPDYVLPNNGYLETCAAVGAGFFHENMNLALADAKYADELERTLYNGVLCGVSLKGNTYFYENPLESNSNRVRWDWHPCPCCPPMFLKMMGAFPSYLYAQNDNELYVNQFAGSAARVTLNGVNVNLTQKTKYPWDGDIQIVLRPEQAVEFGLYLRLPAWCNDPRVFVNGRRQDIGAPVRGYAHLQRRWQNGDKVELSLPMPVQLIKANPAVEADRGRAALQRGPLVYCLEAADNGDQLRNFAMPHAPAFTIERRPHLLGGITIIRGLARIEPPWTEDLYEPSASSRKEAKSEFTAIPYFVNANRQPGDMEVWLKAE